MAHSISLVLRQSRRGIPNEAFWVKHSGWVLRMGLSGWSIPEGYTEWIILNFSISNYSMIQYGTFR